MKFLTIVSVNINLIQILVPEISFELKLTNFEKKYNALVRWTELKLAFHVSCKRYRAMHQYVCICHSGFSMGETSVEHVYRYARENRTSADILNNGIRCD